MSCIYKIVNNVTGQIYVGKTTKTVMERWSHHVAKHRTSGTYLHRSMVKHGLDKFEMTLLEECDITLIDDREKHWIKTLESLAPKNFNMTHGGDGGDTSLSPNFTDAMRNRDQSGSNNPMYGRKRPDTAIYLAKGKQKMIESNQCAVMCRGAMYESIKAAEKALPGISIRKRVDSDRHPDFYRLREKTKRK